VQAPIEALRDYVHAWRNGNDLLAENLAQEAKFSLQQPLQTLHAALETLCEHALRRLPELSKLPIAAIRQRGLTYVRLNQPDQALPLLQQALPQAPREEQFDLHQAIAFAQQASDPQAAITSFTQAIACAPTPELACSLTYNRGALRAALPDEHGNAIADFTFVAANSWNAALRHSALRGRARLNSATQRYDDAIADYSQILADAGATPRTAVSAWMDRGAVYHTLGRYSDAIADWTQAINAADAEPRQRFRTLEARAQTLEKLGKFSAAADDYEAMARFSDIAPRYRDELNQQVAQLRARQHND
jgi:tetratricopeptide (TPR) repeat protein